jgi:hypothetical protein
MEIDTVGSKLKLGLDRAVWYVVGALLLLALAVALFGCSGSVRPSQVAERLPVIRMTDAYPDGLTAEEFWLARQDFFRRYEARSSAGLTTPEEAEAMFNLLKLEHLRRAGEAKIRAYNEYARERNAANGY